MSVSWTGTLLAPTTYPLLPRAYSLILLTLISNWLIVMWQVIKVGAARSKYKIKYPTLYEPKEDSKFNLIQRAHQSTLEWNMHFLVFLVMGGLSCPISSAVMGMVFNVGRVVHAKGYYEGNPHQGLWSLYALMGLVGTTVVTAFRIATY